MEEATQRAEAEVWLPLQKVTSPDATATIARAFAQVLKPGDVVACYGDLGVGKTFFIRQVCRVLGVTAPVTSPTFTLLHVYEARNGWPVYHFDFYRIDQDKELEQLGVEEFFYGQGISLIEWPERVESYLPYPRYQVCLKRLNEEPEARLISIRKLHHD